MSGLSALALSAGCAPKEETSVANPNRLIPKPCWFEAEASWPTTQCYMMEVPENHAEPAGRKIQFPVVRFFAQISDPDKEPLLHLGAGGPGASMGLEPENASDWLWFNYAGMSVEVGRDLIVIDPRGTGMAQPKLACSEFIKDAELAFSRSLSADEEARVFTFSIERCYSRLTETADLAQYNSTAVARDIEALRQALGVPKLNLYGVSYASRYALTIAREFPDSVRAMVLNSAVFPNIIYAQQLPQDVIAAYQRGINYCSQDSKCNKQYPDLQRRLESLVEKLDESPLTVKTGNIHPGEQYPFVLTGQRLLRVLFQALYNESFYKEFPAIIEELESEQAQLLKPAIVSFMGLVLDPNFGDAAGISHFCYEEAPFVDFDLARQSAATSGILGGSVRSDIDMMQMQCRIWAIPSAPLLESRAIKTPVPTLVMHGGLDPVLAASDADQARKKLPNHQWLLFPDLAHDVISASDCAEEAAAQFLDQPDAPVVETAASCRKDELARQAELERKIAEMEAEQARDGSGKAAEGKDSNDVPAANSAEQTSASSAEAVEPATEEPTKEQRHREAPAGSRYSESR
ncbi:alpha/beta hydrolase [Microbulbifer sp. CAU 1566]|uniref:alpha/beta fold hydrolase n=1 Tax=Microbulbifer sp. CAU 1566 TaxID=2933269 RepID=UPI002005EE11|nr:alpha/beta hydrolase [Microbulbifer sp. CAU 1566]MCK7596984.1 alpha/beta hydrolase [Microbulbifer sp. CAU 1566]